MASRNLYQLYDLTAHQASGPILIYASDAPAIRDFHQLLAAGDGTLPGAHPQDFQLRWLGSQDEVTGIIDIANNPTVTIATGQAWGEERQRLMAQEQSERELRERAKLDLERQKEKAARKQIAKR